MALALLTSPVRDVCFAMGTDLKSEERMRQGRSLILAMTVLVLTLSGEPAHAQTPGSVSGLPVPRFVSLRSDKVHVRVGPAIDHDIRWTFARAGLPVEIVAESDNWRRIRDAEGAEGWVHHALLSSRRTALIAPASKEKSFSVFESADARSRVTAELQPGVLAAVRHCKSGWCRISGERFDGYIEQTRLWGVYPNETIE
jgi:SH3-like domain-containing protein